MSRNRSNGQLIAGIILVALGLIFALERFSGLAIYGLYRLWPLIVIGIGAGRLIGAENTKQRSSGLFMVFLGSWFLINTLELFGLDWGESWPLLLILLGLSRLILPEDGRRSGGVLMLLIGAWTFLNVFGIWGFDWDTSWPIGLIVVGLFIVWRAMFERRPTAPSGEVEND